MLLNCDNLLDKFKQDLRDNGESQKTGKEKQTPSPKIEKERLTRTETTITKPSTKQITLRVLTMVVTLNALSSHQMRYQIISDWRKSVTRRVVCPRKIKQTEITQISMNSKRRKETRMNKLIFVKKDKQNYKRNVKKTTRNDNQGVTRATRVFYKDI